MKQYITRFLRFCEYRGLDPKTIARYRFNLNSFADWLGKKQITKETLREFVLYSKNRKPRTNNGLSQKTGLSIYSVNSYISTLKRFVYYLWAEEDALGEDLTGAIRSLRPNTFMPVLLTPVEIYSIIKCPRTWGKYHKWIDRRKYDFFLRFWLGVVCGEQRLKIFVYKILILKMRLSELLAKEKKSEQFLFPK